MGADMLVVTLGDLLKSDSKGIEPRWIYLGKLLGIRMFDLKNRENAL